MRALQAAIPLRPGDTVATLAPSSALEDDQRLHEGLAVLRCWGLCPLEQNVSARRWGHLAGTDQERLHDLNQEAPLLACARGGWGSARLLEHPMVWQPGWLLGFSDVTSLLWARLSAGFAGGIHGPLLTTLAAEPAWSQERLRQLLFGETLPALEGEPRGGGQATGPLLAANLTVASHLLGSNHVPDLQGAILILEDVGEAPDRIDRMLTHWRLCGALQQLGGIGFGQFEGCDSSPDDPLTTTLAAVLDERTADLNIPVVMNLPVGHVCGNAALPMGQLACLDGNRGSLSLVA